MSPSERKFNSGRKGSDYGTLVIFNVKMYFSLLLTVPRSVIRQLLSVINLYLSEFLKLHGLPRARLLFRESFYWHCYGSSPLDDVIDKIPVGYHLGHTVFSVN